LKAPDYLALKFLSGKGRGLLFSWLTYMAILGVAISVAACLVIQACISGLNQDVREKVLSFSSHVVWTLQPGAAFDPSTWDQLAGDSEVSGIMHYVEGEAIIRGEEEDQIEGVRVRGIDPRWGIPRFSLEVLFNEGEDWKTMAGSEQDSPAIVLGTELIGDLGLVSFMRDPVDLLYPLGEVGPTGDLEPNIRSFHLGGRFHSGYPEYDMKFALVDLESAKRLLGDAATEQIGVYLRDPFRATAFAERHKGIAGVKAVKTWEQLNRNLFHVLKMERTGMGLVLALMILLASFNILSLLIMLVFQRRRDFGVLKALGMSARETGKLLYRAGLWIGISGGGLGVLLGLGIMYLLTKYPIHLPEPYNIDRLPVVWNPWMIALTAAIAVGMSLVATWFPAWQSRRLNAVESLRRE